MTNNFNITNITLNKFTSNNKSYTNLTYTIFIKNLNITLDLTKQYINNKTKNYLRIINYVRYLWPPYLIILLSQKTKRGIPLGN